MWTSVEAFDECQGRNALLLLAELGNLRAQRRLLQLDEWLADIIEYDIPSCDVHSHPGTA